MANPGVQIKALEKKMALYDKKFDQYDKQLRQIDYTALCKKLDKLEKTVALLIDTTKNPAKFLGNDFMSPKEINELTKKSEERAIELNRKQIQQQLLLQKKERDKAQKQMQKYVEKNYIEARLKTLDALVQSALSKR